ncbi:B-cell receptor CD22-like isoform X2 [Colossoma macropomum]|uniref:B-cell receptor CD22-like isoform X2 n=1 Tax=Colossoma macropomum TaxID=42526 RepID=UPI001864564F|nr:B-cell receptor CD22-like isoform X2 [Colossoma macropomum]
MRSLRMAPPLPLIFLLMIVELHMETPEEVTEGETADLSCKTTCSLIDPTFVWYKNGRPLTTKTIKNNQLHLQTVSSEDAGSYSCAVRGYQHNSTAHNLRVRYPPKNVSVSISASREIVEGSSVTLTCNSDANPPVKIYTWFKGSTSVGKEKTYSIPNIRSEDSGEYTCQSRNDHGERRSTAVQINVTYPPKSVSVSISPSGDILEGSSVTLNCSSDANPPVKIYTWFKKGGTSPVGSGQNYSIISITADHTGLYYCVAQNEHGALNGSVMVTVKSQSLSAVWIAVGGGSFILITALICIYRMKKRAAGTDHSEPKQDDILYTTVTRSTSRPVQAADSADSGADDVLYATVGVQNDEVTSTDQQGEPQYASVTFHHHTAATGSPTQNEEDPSVIYSTIRKD